MKVLVAGGTGALGRRVVRGLVEAGHTVAASARSRRTRAHRGILNAASGDDGAQRLQGEGVLDQVGHGHRQGADELPQLGGAEVTAGPRQPEAGQDVPGVDPADVRRRRTRDLRQDGAESPDALVEGKEGVCVGR